MTSTPMPDSLRQIFGEQNVEEMNRSQFMAAYCKATGRSVETLRKTLWLSDVLGAVANGDYPRSQEAASDLKKIEAGTLSVDAAYSKWHRQALKFDFRKPLYLKLPLEINDALEADAADLETSRQEVLLAIVAHYYGIERGPNGY